MKYFFRVNSKTVCQVVVYMLLRELALSKKNITFAILIYEFILKKITYKNYNNIFWTMITYLDFSLYLRDVVH